MINEKRVYVDGVHYLLEGQNIQHGVWDTWSPNGGRWTVPPMYPMLVALFHYFISDLTRAGQFVSLAVSITVIPAIFLIARSAFGSKSGLWAAFITAVDPLAAHYSILTYAEPTYIAMLVWCVWFCILTIEKGKGIIPPVFAGIFAALTYLAKAFGFAICIWGFIVILYYTLSEKSKNGKRSLIAPALYLGTFLIICIPYWIFLISYLGHFAFDGKSQFEFGRMYAPTLAQEKIDPRYEGIIDKNYDYEIYSGKPEFGYTYGGTFVRNFINKYLQKLNEVFLVYPTSPVAPFAYVHLTTPIYLILLGLGLFSIPLSLSTKSQRALLMWAPLWLFIAPLGFIEIRYYAPFVILMIPFAGGGMNRFEDWLKNTFLFKNNRARAYVVPLAALLFFAYCFPALAFHLTHSWDPKTDYDEYQVAGDFLREYTHGQGGNLIESADMISYHAGMQGWVTPDTDYVGLLHFMLKHDIKYFAMDEYLTTHKHKRRGLRWLFKFPPQETDELKPIYWDEQIPGQRVVIYELKDETIEMWKEGLVE